MLGVKDLIKEAESLPVEERMLVIDTLLKSLNTLDAEIEEKWLRIAKRRLSELQSGKVKPVCGKISYGFACCRR